VLEERLSRFHALVCAVGPRRRATRAMARGPRLFTSRLKVLGRLLWLKGELMRRVTWIMADMVAALGLMTVGR
jgi:hypothetical protein